MIRRRLTPDRLAWLAGAAAATAASIGVATAAAPASAHAGGKAAGSGLAAAKAFVKQYESTPKAISLTTPLKSRPPKGKTLVFMQCSLAQCQQIDNDLKQAVKAVGWKLKTIDWNSTESSTLVSGMQSALQYHPVAVAIISEPYATWQQVIPAYKKAGVKIIPMTVGAVPTSSTVPVNIGGPRFYNLLGRELANWFIADSNGRGHAVFANAPEFQVFAELGAGFASTIKSECPACQVTTVDQSITNIENSDVSNVVSAVKRDPSIKYVLTSDGANILPLPSALKTAGLSKIKIAGDTPTIDNEAALLNGSEQAWGSVSFTIAAWEVVDAAARSYEGMKVPVEDGGMPTEILTKGNVGKPSTDWTEPKSYASLYKKLWHI